MHSAMPDALRSVIRRLKFLWYNIIIFNELMNDGKGFGQVSFSFPRNALHLRVDEGREEEAV